MATVTGNNQVKLNNGQTVTAQEGGWYDGQQFVKGSLSNPGQINAQSTQQGAGQQVSSQVVAQTNPNNVQYLQGEQEKLTTPTNPNEVAGYLNAYQNNVHQSIGGQDLTGNNADTVMGQAINENRPQPPNLSQTYQGLAGQFNISGLNAQMTDLQTKANAIQTSLKTAFNQTENQPGVTADVVAGRESEQQRQAQIQLDSINLQMGVVSQQLSNANNTISMIMSFTQQDYTNASQAFDASFQEAYQIQSLIQSQAQFQAQMGFQQQQAAEAKSEFQQSQGQQAAEFEISAEQQQAQFKAQLGQQAQQVASANLGVITNMILSGQINLANLTPDQKQHIQGLETQAGLPQGFTSMIASNTMAGSKYISANPYTGQVLVQLPNGNFNTIETGMQPTYQDEIAAQAMKLLQSDKAIQKVETSPGIFGMFKSYSYNLFNPITQKMESFDNQDDAIAEQNKLLNMLQGGGSSNFSAQDMQDIQAASQ